MRTNTLGAPWCPFFSPRIGTLEPPARAALIEPVLITLLLRVARAEAALAELTVTWDEAERQVGG